MSIKEIDIDLNSIFNLSYSFDSLKLYLKQVNENEQAMAKKIEDLEKKLKNMNDVQTAFQKGIMQNQSSFDKKLKALDTTVKEKIKRADETKSISMMKTKQDVVDKTKTDVVSESKPALVSESKPADEIKPADEAKPSADEETKKEETTEQPKEEEINLNFANQGEQSKPLEETEEKPKQYGSSNNPPSEIKKKEEMEEKEDENLEDEEGYEFHDVFNSNNLQIDNLEFEELKKRVSDLEKKLKDFQGQKLFNFGAGLGNSNDGELEAIKDSIYTLEASATERLKDCESMKVDIDNLKIKMEDFNIADLFKDCKTEDGSIDSAKLLVNNLEAKVFKKIGLIDERIKKDEEGLFKTKNDINTLKNGQDSNQRSLDSLKNDLKSIVDMLQSTSNSLNDKMDELEKKLTDLRVTFNKTIVDNDKYCKNSIDQINAKFAGLSGAKEDTGESKVAAGGLSESDLNLLKELSRKVNELDKNVKSLSQNPFMNDIKKEINKIKSELAIRALTQDLYDLNDKVNDHGLKISEMRDNIENLIKDSITNTENINFLTKKLETISSTISLVRQGFEGASGSSRQSFIDSTKFLEINAFHDFVKRYDRDLDKIRKELDELRRYFNDMAQAIKSKAEEDDVRNLDASLNAKIEEIRLACNRKFADKTDTSKSIKYLDAQLKHIIEVYIKKADKGDNWLLAKKPVGYQCASCEAFIGDLKDKKDEFLSWNKYPIRDPTNNKGYRIGNGFSRMLNMLSLDVKSYEGKDGNLSDNEEKKKNVTNLNTSLPSIPPKRMNEEEVSKAAANTEMEEEKERNSSPSS